MKNIFVSSTFSDFHYERDILRSKVMPRINEAARKYGEYINFCDLRWGINTTEMYEKSTIKVLSVCLDEIDRSRPYMIVMLGNRYGFVPESKYILNEAEKRGLFLEDLEISITQLEIEYGALQNTDSLKYIFFYFREIEDNEGDYLSSEIGIYYEKLKALKKRIYETTKGKVHFYKVNPNRPEKLDEFAEMVYNDIKNTFIEEWKHLSQMSYFEKENYNQWKYINEKKKSFKIGDKFAENIIKNFNDPKNGNYLIAINGVIGSGKSTCFSHICCCMKNNGWDVIPFLCGKTSLSTDENSILKSLVWKMEDITESSHIFDELSNELYTSQTKNNSDDRLYLTQQFHYRLNELCDIYSHTGKKLLVAIDALDCIQNQKNIKNYCFIPDFVSDNIKILLTSTKFSKMPLGSKCITIPNVSEDEKNIVIQGILNENGKQLAKSVIDVLLAKKSSNNPLFLYMAVNRLCLMNYADYLAINENGGQIEDINERQLNIIKNFSDDLKLMSSELLYKVADVVSRDSLKKCAEYIAVSRQGMRTTDLEILLEKENLKFSQLEFSIFVNYINELFILKNDGRYDFMHISLRNGILNTISNKNEIHKAIVQQLLSLDENDPIRMQEVIYHMIQADMKNELINYIFQINNIEENFVTEDIYTQCIADGGEYVKNLIAENLAKWYLTDELFNFIFFFELNSSNKFKEKKEDVELYIKILEEIINMLEAFLWKVTEKYEKQAENIEDFDNNSKKYTEVMQIYISLDKMPRIIYLGYKIIGNFLEITETSENMQKATEYFMKSMTLCRIKMEKNPDVDTYADFGIILKKYEAIASVPEESESIFLQALEIAEKVAELDGSEIYIRNFAISNKDIGIFYTDFDTPEITQKGLKYLNKAKDILRELIIKNPSIINRYELCCVLNDIGVAYSNMTTNENVEASFDFFNEALEIAQKLYIDTHSSKNLYLLISIYLHLGFSCEKTENIENMKRALEYYKKSYDYSCEAWKLNGLPKSMNNIINACYYMGTAASNLSREEDLKYALKCCRKGYKMALSFVKINNVRKNKKLLAKAAISVAIIYHTTKGKENLLKAIKLCNESLDILKQFPGKTASDKKEISKTLSILGTIYDELGDKESVKKALSYYLEALKISKAIVEEEGESVDKLRNVEIDCHRIGIAYMNIDKEKAKKYLEDGLEIAEKLANKYNYDLYKWDLSYSLYQNGGVCMLFNEIEKAKDYFYRAVEIRQKLYENKKTAKSKKSLAISYSVTAEAYHKSQYQADTINSVYFSQKSTALLEELMKELNTTESKLLAAKSCEQTAEYAEQAGGMEFYYILLAEKYYIRCIGIYDNIAAVVGTYKFYIDYISICTKIAAFYIKIKKSDNGEKFFDKAIEIANQFLQLESDYEYKLLLPDIFMNIVEYYRKTNWEKYKYKIKELCVKSLEMYEEIYSQNKDLCYLGNIASIHYSIAEAYLNIGDKLKAIEYFEKNISITDLLPKKEKTIERIICAYTSCSRIAYIHMENGNQDDIYKALNFFKKAVDREYDVLEETSTSSYASKTIEILTDMQQDINYAAICCETLGMLNEAEHFYKEMLHIMYPFIKLIPEENEIIMLKVCTKIIELKMKQGKNLDSCVDYLAVIAYLTKKYPEFKSALDAINQIFQVEIKEENVSMLEKASNYYELAEHYLDYQNDIEKAVNNFKLCIEIMENIPFEEKSTNNIIYEYNSFSHLGAILANKNNIEAYKESVKYYSKAIELELTAVERLEKDERIVEIMTDLQDDCSHIIAVCTALKDTIIPFKYFNISIDILTRLVKINSRDYINTLDRTYLNYIIFCVVNGNIEKSEELIAKSVKIANENSSSNILNMLNSLLEMFKKFQKDSKGILNLEILNFIDKD